MDASNKSKMVKVVPLEFYPCYDVNEAKAKARAFIESCHSILSFHDDVTSDDVTTLDVERMRSDVRVALNAVESFLTALEQRATR